jgi:hypothetical protein
VIFGEPRRDVWRGVPVESLDANDDRSLDARHPAAEFRLAVVIAASRKSDKEVALAKVARTRKARDIA